MSYSRAPQRPQNATVTVQYVNQPDRNPDFGSIKDDRGGYWGVPVDMLDNFQEGQTYDVEYTTNRGQNGRTYKNIVGIGSEVRSTAAPSRAAPRSPPSAGPDPLKDDKIAVLALAKEGMNKIPIGDTAAIRHHVQSVLDAWRQVNWAKKPDPRIQTGRDLGAAPENAEFNDEIPFDQ